MKSLIRSFLLTLITLYGVAFILPGFTYTGGFRTLLLGTLGFMLINLAIIPLLKILFLPLNILTLGIFTWVINVIALYLLTTIVPQFKILPYAFPGANFGAVTLPPQDLNVLWVAIIASFLIGFISHFFHWLVS